MMRCLLLAGLALILVGCSEIATAPGIEPDMAVAAPGLYLIGGHPSNAPNVIPEKVFSRLGIFTARMNPQAAEALRHNPHIRYVQPPQIVWLSEIPWHLDRINQREPKLDGFFDEPGDGAGVRIYIVDTGIDASHPEFTGRASLAFDYYDGDGLDLIGHGTHVAGLAGGATHGIARQASLFSVRVFDQKPSIPDEIVIAALNWLLGQSPGVVNMSLGTNELDLAMNDATQQLINAGFVVTVSAGNNWGEDACTWSPASVLGALTVGASDQKTWKKWRNHPVDRRAQWSNAGPCIDLFAPGSAIESSIPGGGYGLKSGTSMAAPLVAGVAALAWASGILAPDIPDAIKAWSTKNVVFQAETENAHMLYVWPVMDPDNGDPPIETKGKSR